MPKSIKNFKPTKGRYKQGYLNESLCTKYVGEKPVIYRSGLEYYWMKRVDSDKTKLGKNVIAWSSETLEIPYFDANGKKHRYFIDLILKMIDGVVWLVEIKPEKLTHSGSWEWNKNCRKWIATKEFARKRNMVFVIAHETGFKHINDINLKL